MAGTIRRRLDEGQDPGVPTSIVSARDQTQERRERKRVYLPSRCSTPTEIAGT